MISLSTAHIYSDALSDLGQYEATRKEFQMGAMSQLQSVKAMVRDEKKRREKKQSAIEGSDGFSPRARTDNVSAILAEVFLKLRNSLNDMWLELKDAESSCADEVKTVRRNLIQAV